MFQFFANPFLLTGLAATALPFIAHLLSRRRWDHVEWGAMQFLDLSRKSRRRVQLEELLLLLIRAGLIAFVVFAIARPWIPGTWLWGFQSGGGRAVVLLVDGSTSMSRKSGLLSLHQQAVKDAEEFLATLSAEDSCALIDARDQPRAVIASPLQDLQAVGNALRELPPPAGACSMLNAIERAVALLAKTTATSREIVIFSDSQAEPWQADNEAAWLRVREILELPAVPPRIWIRRLDANLAMPMHQISVATPQLSREVTVSGFPLQIRSVIRNGGDSVAEARIQLLLNGQPLAGESRQVTIPANGEIALDFEHRLRTLGCQTLTVAADGVGDPVPADNRKHAVIRVTEAVPVLMICGNSDGDIGQRSTFFAEMAFAGLEDDVGWIQTSARTADRVTAADLEQAAVIICSDVGQLSAELLVRLEDRIRAGVGLMIACGPRTTPEQFNRLWNSESHILPTLQYVDSVHYLQDSGLPAVIAPLSIRSGWLDRFRSDPGRSFLQAGIRSWARFASQPVVEGLTDDYSEPAVLAQLSTGDPALLECVCGEGRVLLLTTSMDRTWTDFPAKSDFVPFLHEAVFHLLPSGGERNLVVGEPVVLQDYTGGMKFFADNPRSVRIENPNGEATDVVVSGAGRNRRAVFPETFLPGIYTARLAETPAEMFVVQSGESEDRLQLLQKEDLSSITSNGSLQFVESLNDLRQEMYEGEVSLELWAAMLVCFLLLLLAEGLATRRAVQALETAAS